MTVISQHHSQQRTQVSADANSVVLPKLNLEKTISSANHVAPELSEIKMPSLSAARPIQDSIPSFASPEQSAKSAKDEGPALATVGEKISQDVSHIFRDKKSESGFVEVAKKIGRAILAFFTR